MHKIVEIALAEVGYQDGPNRDSKYGVWFGLNHVYDCGEFVSWAYFHAGYPLGRMDFMKGFASVPFALKHFTATNEITKFPQEGDIVIFTWNGKDAQHVGIFVKDNGDGTITTLEGDTTNPNFKINGGEGSGGWVQQKIRNKNLVLAYVHPKVLDQQPIV